MEEKISYIEIFGYVYTDDDWTCFDFANYFLQRSLITF